MHSEVDEIVEITPTQISLFEEMYPLYQQLFLVNEEAETLENLKKVS
ncbi:hypothetical protein V6M85_06880 [Sulfolobus tengchongensis]|uniref:Uncharacterized protein n=1 Tax=Sulfolobus tengchongensis TaxID=207809 RepID=A0AAX4KYL0_9CREN